MRYIIKGNDFSFTWTIKDCNGYVDLSAVTDLKVMYQHSTVPSKKYVADARIVDIVLKEREEDLGDTVLYDSTLVKGIEFEVTAEQQQEMLLGDYNVICTFIKNDDSHCYKMIRAYTIVADKDGLKYCCSESKERLVKLSQLINDMGFITRDDLPTKVSELQNDCNYVNINSVPTKLSQLVNDSNFASKDEVPKYTTELSNDAQFTNVVDLAKKVDKESGKGLSTNDYTNEDKTKLTNLSDFDSTGINKELKELEEALAAKADISEIPNFTSDLINDSKFVTSSDLLAENVGYDSTTVKDTLDSLLYEAINITSFTSNVEPVQEIGTNINSITLTWKLSQPATEQFINDVPVTGSSFTFDTPFNSNKSFTLKVNDGTTIKSKTIDIKFMNNIYYGVSSSTTYNSSFIESLTKELRQATEMNFRVNAGKDEYICFAYPSHYGEAVFSVGGFEGGFREVAKFYYTNESGYNEQYTVYCSDNPCLGDTRVKVIYV